MEIVIKNQNVSSINKKINNLLKKTKREEIESINEMILVYENYLDLKKEFEYYDFLSDESLKNFEGKI